MIVANNIVKNYSQIPVLSNVSFTLAPGLILGVMGANGAGKSSLLDIVATFDCSFSGEVEVMGYNVKKEPLKIAELIGYVPGVFSLYGHLTVKENILFFANMYGCSGEVVLNSSNRLWLSLEPFSNSLTKNLSGGMRQKLAILCALVHSPKLLILDEPTVGIDPATRVEIWKEFLTLKKSGISIIIATHNLEEIEYLDKLLFLHEGSRLLYGSPTDLVERFQKRVFKVTGCRPYIIYKELKEREKLGFSYISQGCVNVVSEEYVKNNIEKSLENAGLSNCVVQQVQPTFEDLFVNFLLEYKAEKEI